MNKSEDDLKLVPRNSFIAQFNNSIIGNIYVICFSLLAIGINWAANHNSMEIV
jgi:hypothetical protein